MSEKLQKFGYMNSAYLRPTQKWRCGRAQECVAGPTSKGRCPLADHPCVPERSVKAQKRRIILWVMALALSLCALFFSSDKFIEYLSPGPLSMGHAEVAECQDCHAAATESKWDWLHKAILLNSNNDDKKCLSCHELGTHAFAPHSTSKENLSRGPDIYTTPFEALGQWDVELAGQLHNWQSKRSEEISCATCHREHQGSLANIEEIDPKQCHVCHTVKFSDLAAGHPPYTQFPHTRATRIEFDHGAHLNKHFLESKVADLAPEGCIQCHAPDQSGEWMLTSSFESSCSSCHLEEVLGDTRSGSKGIAVLSVPELDVQTLHDAGFNIGYWPAWADGEIGPIMRMLLSKERQDTNVLQNQGFELYDLESASVEELRSVAELAWEIKQLFFDIQVGGTTQMDRRIIKAVGRDLDRSTLNRLIASLPKDTLLNNQKEWFPGLIEEVTRFKSGEIGLSTPSKPPSHTQIQTRPVPERSIQDSSFSEEGILTDDDEFLLDDDDTEALTEDDDNNGLELEGVDDNEEWAATGGWYRDGSQIRYRPREHADSFLKNWLDVSSALQEPNGKLLFDALSAEDAVGNCTKCHTVEKQSSKLMPGSLENIPKTALSEQIKQHVDWKSFQPSDISGDFNRFSHAAHYSLMTDLGCESCHKLNNKDERNEVGHEIESLVIDASFMNIEKETCTQCHQPGRAPDSCLTCHNYHVEPFLNSFDKMQTIK